MDINFILLETTYLKYFMPLVIEGNKRGLKSNMFIRKSPVGKYNCPYKNIDEIKNLSRQFEFNIGDLDQNREFAGLTFLLEGCGLPDVPNRNKKIVLTSLRDFKVLYKDYIDGVDNVIMASKFMATHYGKISNKNLYLGSPKYDIQFNGQEILNKYQLNDSKKALIIFPLLEILNKVNLARIYDFLHRMEFEIIVKTRAKDKTPFHLRGDKYFEDFTWFPHTTMELMEVSDIVINFSSTTVKECIMMNMPLINFHVKPEEYFGFLYNDKYSAQLGLDAGFDHFRHEVNRLTSCDLSKDFYEAREKYLFQPNYEISKIILDTLGY